MKSIFLTIGFFVAHLALASGAPPAQTSSSADSAVQPALQFTVGDHVVRFDARIVRLAGLRQAMTIEFVNANSVVPTGSTMATSGKPVALDRVMYPNLWQGVDLEYALDANNKLKSTYHVAAGADTAAIRLRYNAPLLIEADGSMNIQLSSGGVNESAPIAWQIIDGKKSSVEVRFERISTHEVGFALGEYDPRHSLIIDPTYSWHRFNGGAGNDIAYGICVDGNGDLIIAGESDVTFSVDVGTVDLPNIKAPKNAYTFNSDIVVAKYGSDGSYKWHTFLGGTGNDRAYGVRVDGSGNILLAGTSSVSFNVGLTGPQNAHAGGSDMVIAKLASDGTYQWHTFLGGTGIDYASGAGVDGSGNVVVAGYSSTTFDVGVNGPLRTHSGSYDMTVAKLNSSGAFQWHTFLGGTGLDRAYAVCVDSTSNIIVAGECGASFNDGVNGPIGAHSGGSDLAVAKLDTNGTVLWHTFHGSAGSEAALGSCMDSQDNILLAGYGTATFNVGLTGPLNAHAGGTDMLVMKLNKDGAYQWHAFYGSTEGESARCVSVDASANLVVAGQGPQTFNVNGLSPEIAHSSNVGNDMVAVGITPQGVHRWHTFYGLDASPSNVPDASYTAYGVGLSADGKNIYLAGDGGLTNPETDFNAGITDPRPATSNVSKILIVNTGDKSAVRYNAGLGSGSFPIDPQTYSQGDQVTVLFSPLPTRNGYTFEKWSDDEGIGYINSPSFDTFIMPSGSVNLTPKWTANTYTVTFNSAGGTAVAPITKNYGSAVTTPTAPTKTGYTFNGWTPVVPTTMPASNTTCVAQWTLNTYAVTYNKNSATSGTPPAAQTKTHGASLTLQTNTGTLARTGYTFAGWNTQADGLGTNYAPASAYTANALIILYAKWTLNTYAVTYNKNSATGGSPPAAQTKTHGVSLTLQINTSPLVRTGYTFAGWNTQADGLGTNYAVASAYTANAIVTLYAKWTPNTYAVTYNKNSATGGSPPAAQTKTHGVSLTLQLNTSPLVRTGYTFAGWNTQADGLGTNYAVASAYTANAIVTLYAKWTPNTYAVTYNKNSATGGSPPAAQTKTHGVSLTLQLNTSPLVRTGYTFAGWNTQADGLGTNYAVSSAYTANALVTLFAKWTANDYTITFDSAGGSAVTAITQNYGTAVTAPTNPTRTGYTFNGWTPAVPTTMPASDTTCVAQWTSKIYTIWFPSIGANDGVVIESSENSNVGGTINNTATSVTLGDDVSKRQFRTILSFSTASLPDNAVITQLTLKCRQQSIVGSSNLVTNFQGFMVDIKNGFFGSSPSLELADFQSAISGTYAHTNPLPINGYYSFNLTNAKAHINKFLIYSGQTQIRLRFRLDDNNDSSVNFLNIFSGDAFNTADRPQLIISYTLP